MRFRRALVVADPKGDPTLVASCLGGAAPRLELAIVVGLVPTLTAWTTGDAAPDPLEGELETLERWRAAIAGAAVAAELRAMPRLELAALSELALGEDVDLLVGAGRTLAAARLVVAAGRHLGVAVLWPSGERRRPSVSHVLCVASGHRAQAAIAAFLREHADPSLEVSIVGPAAADVGDVAAAMRVLGIRSHVRLLSGSIVTARSALAQRRDRAVDLVLLARAPALLLEAYPWPAPVLVVPATRAALPRAQALDVADAVDLRGTARARVHELTPRGSLVPAANAALAVVVDGHVRRLAQSSSSGDIELERDAPYVGVTRDDDGEPVDIVTAAKQRFAVLSPTPRPLLLFDAELAADRLSRLAASSVEPLAVRLRPTSPASSLRERLRASGLPPLVIDAAAVLDEGDAFDVAAANDAVRLRRVARRMVAAGYAVAAVFDATLEQPEAYGDPPAPATAGNRVAIELDNALARRWLLEAIAESRRSVHLQVYMAADDEIGREVERALAAAAARGVATLHLHRR
jgi:hypothetical protein